MPRRSTRALSDAELAALFRSGLARIGERAPDPIQGKRVSKRALDALPKRIEPEVGTFRYVLAPSYRLFLETMGPVDAALEDEDPFRIYGPDDVVEVTSGRVHIPAGVSQQDEKGREREVSTTHLVAFAEGPGAGTAWCFDTTSPDEKGELPVYFHDQDEPTAARWADGGPVERDREPDYPSFVSWFEDQVARLAGEGKARRPAKATRATRAKREANFRGERVKRLRKGHPWIVPAGIVRSTRGRLELVRVIGSHRKPIYRVAVSGDGALVASHSSPDEVLKVWELATGRLACEKATTASDLAFASDGRLLVGADEAILVLDARAGSERARFESPGAALAVRDGLLLAGSQGSVVLRELASGKERWRTLCPDLEALALGPGGTRALVATGRSGKPGSLDVWDTKRNEKLGSFARNNGTQAISVDAEGKLAVAVTRQGYGDPVTLLSLGENEVLRSWDAGSSWVRDVAFVPGGRAYTSCSDGLDRLWDVASGVEVDSIAVKSGGALAVHGTTLVQSCGGELLVYRLR